MSKFRKKLVVILTLGLLIADARAYLCKDCRRESEQLCNIKNETGYSILYETVQNTDRLLYVNSPTTKDKDICIPKGMVIKETSIGVACVWSPARGCQMLLDESDEYMIYSCVTCRFDVDDDGKKRCPCIRKDPVSGSGHFYNGILPIIMLIYFVNLFL